MRDRHRQLTIRRPRQVLAAHPQVSPAAPAERWVRKTPPGATGKEALRPTSSQVFAEFNRFRTGVSKRTGPAPVPRVGSVGPIVASKIQGGNGQGGNRWTVRSPFLIETDQHDSTLGAGSGPDGRVAVLLVGYLGAAIDKGDLHFAIRQRVGERHQSPPAALAVSGGQERLLEPLGIKVEVTCQLCPGHRLGQEPSRVGGHHVTCSYPGVQLGRPEPGRGEHPIDTVRRRGNRPARRDAHPPLLPPTA